MALIDKLRKTNLDLSRLAIIGDDNYDILGEDCIYKITSTLILGIFQVEFETNPIITYYFSVRDIDGNQLHCDKFQSKISLLPIYYRSAIRNHLSLTSVEIIEVLLSLNDIDKYDS